MSLPVTIPAAAVCSQFGNGDIFDAGAFILTDDGLYVSHGDGTVGHYPPGSYRFLIIPTPSLN